MDRVSIADMTMKQSRRGVEFALSFREKIELAKLLDRLGVSVIELTPITNPRIDSLLIKSIGSAVRESAVAVPVGIDPSLPEIAWKALGEAKHPRLQVDAPVSAVQMEYIAGRKPDALIAAIDSQVRACKSLCPDVEFIAGDATRAEPAFVQKAIRTAVSAGANVITVCDAAGTMLPDEMEVFLNGLYDAVEELKDVRLGISCSSDYALADACAIAAVQAGARELKTAAYNFTGISLEHMADIIFARGEQLGVETGIRMTQKRRLLEQIAWMCSTGRSKNSPFDTGVQEDSGMYLTAHDDMAAVMKAVSGLGYDLSEEDSVRVFEAFSRIAAKKEKVGAKELDAIVASAAMQVPATYKIKSYVINNGNIISATAHLQLEKDGRILEGIGLGDGPIDASFLAIEQIVGHHYELDDFQIQAITEGHEAMGESVVKLRSGGKLFSGRGISTDIIGASIRAYINALNKIVYEGGTY